MSNRNPYIWSGFGLFLAGILIALPAYLVLHLIWLTALGLCMIILSLILIALGRSIPRLPPEVCNLLLETGIENIATILEELGITNRALYLPSSLAGGQPRAFIPQHAGAAYPKITKPLGQRLVTRYSENLDDIGVLVSTIGSTAVGMLESRPGARVDELEAALTSLFVGMLGIAEGTTVTPRDNRVIVDINKPHIENDMIRSHQSLGGPLASIAASVAAEAWDKPVVINREEQLETKYSIVLEVME